MSNPKNQWGILRIDKRSNEHEWCWIDGAGKRTFWKSTAIKDANWLQKNYRGSIYLVKKLNKRYHP